RAPREVRDRARGPAAPAAGGPRRGPGHRGLLPLPPRPPGPPLRDRPPDRGRGPLRRGDPPRGRGRCGGERDPVGLGLPPRATVAIVPAIAGGAPRAQ